MFSIDNERLRAALLALVLSPIALVFLAPIRARDAGETPKGRLLSDAKYVHYVLSGYESLSDSDKLPDAIGDLEPYMRSSVAWNLRHQFPIAEGAKGKRWEDLPDDSVVLIPVAEDAEDVLGVKNPGLTKDGRLVSGR